VVSGFVRDVGRDYKNFFSAETAWWLGGGGGAAWAVHAADQSIADSVQANPPSLPGGSLYGSQLVQIPVAIGWWLAGSAAGSARQAEVGRDLLRAQLSVVSWTYAVKFAADRTRPNGDPRSFPSGHATQAFTVATVIATEYPSPWVKAACYVPATIVLYARMRHDAHWASDVTAGALIGYGVGRSVARFNLQRREGKPQVRLLPVFAPGVSGVALTVRL
jgi:membrane-associated phospholipid phosphatase